MNLCFTCSKFSKKKIEIRRFILSRFLCDSVYYKMLSQPYAAASIARKTDVKFNVKDINMFFGVIRYTYWDIIF